MVRPHAHALEVVLVVKIVVEGRWVRRNVGVVADLGRVYEFGHGVDERKLHSGNFATRIEFSFNHFLREFFEICGIDRVLVLVFS